MKPPLTIPFMDWKRRKFGSLSQLVSGFRSRKYSLDQEKETQKYERLPSWKELGVEFVNRTTWHGLKYIAIPSRFLLRRVIWIMILLSNAILFIYIMTTRKDLLMTYPSSISVEVSYKDVLPFSAITICNHNPYRLTAMQDMGLYDLLVNDLGSSPDRVEAAVDAAGGGGRGAKKTVLLNETTRGVCMSVCANAYDWTCSGVFYDRRTRSCVLSSYGGDWVDADQRPCGHGDDARVEFYRRYRCADSAEINCNFEDNACTLTVDPDQNDKWKIVEAAGHHIQMDNTLDLASGHVANLLLTELRPGYRARFQSDYMNTTGMCLQLFYWLLVDDPTTSESATLSVILITEERVETVVLAKSKGPQDWSLVFVRLPDGVHQVVVEGKRGFVGQSGICLDDIAVKDCKKFDHSRNCKVTRRGRAYRGTINVTTSGEPCLPWESINSPLINRLPDTNPADAENYCRNIPLQNWNEPSCFVRLRSLAVRPKPCSIPYCECLNSSYFRCNSGMCLPRNFICNGIDDCLDGSDELDICNSSRSIECYFDTDYKCGYESNHVGALRFLRLSASDLRYYYGTNIISVNVSALEQLMLVDSKLGQMGDQVQLVSPLWTFKRPTLLRITYIMMGSVQPADSKAGLYLYQYSALHVPVRLLFSATRFTSRDLLVSDVCVPGGTYHLMFLGIQGIPYESDFALDIVKIVGECNYVEEPMDNSFNCNFMTMCGYRFISSSALFTWVLIYTNNAFMKNDDLCSAEFGGVDGVITSPGYPGNYDNNLSCYFSIRAPPGVSIEITFVEFLLEPESDCLFDRLEITDPFENRTKIYCGNSSLPPVFRSKGSILNFLFKTDGSVNNGRFKLSYKTPIISPQGTDFAITLTYSGLRSSTDFVHTAKLMSPTVSISSSSCLTIMLMATSSFAVKMAYLRNQVYMERLLVASPRPLGGKWHKIYFTLSPLMSNYKPFIIVFEAAAAAPKMDAAIINDIRMLNGSCRSIMTNGTIACEFDEISQCGYLDASKNSLKWLRNYDMTSDTYYMQTYLDPAQPDEAVLQSAVSEVTREQCVEVTYFSSSQDVNIVIESNPPSFLLNTQVNTSTSDRLTFGNAYIQQDLPIGNYSIVLRGFLRGESLSGKVEELKVYGVELLDRRCPSNETVDTFCNFDNPNLCGYAINFPYGEPWTWAKFDNIVVKNSSKNHSVGSSDSNHNNVMMYNNSSPYLLKGVLASSGMSKKDSELMIFEAYTNSANSSFIEVYTEPQGSGFYSRLSVEGDLLANRWTNLSVCLPTGSFLVMFVATVSRANLVAIDNVRQTNIPCSLSGENVSDCLESDLDYCKEYQFSWSPQFDWRYTSDIRNDTIIPGGDGCVHVYYQTEGIVVFNKIGKQYMEATTCDLYIKGLTMFVIEMWFEEFEIRNCELQYLEIWTNSGTDFTNGNKKWCTDLENAAKTPFVFHTDRVIHIKIFAYDGYPSFRLRYRYTPDTMSGLFLALHYIDTNVSNALTINRVAQWSSKTLFPSGDRICVNFDMAIQSGLLEVVHVETDPDSRLVVSKTVLEWRGTKADHASWAHGTFEVPLETNGSKEVHFFFYISIMNATFAGDSETFVGALRNVRFYNGSCSGTGSAMSVPSFCQFSHDHTCGFRDLSKDSSHWVLQSHRAKYSTAGDCKVSLDGLEYIGNISNTISGRHCQRWDRQSPHAHNQDVADYFPDLHLVDAADHCRNPSNPFIVRSSWCYTMDPKQRREYCDIPFCLDYIMETQMLADQASRSVLASDPVRLNSSVCLGFRYQLTSTVVELTVKIATNKSSVSDSLRTFSIPAEPTSFVWKTGSVDLPSNTTRIYFVADKLDVTDFDQFVSLDNISISEGPCVNSESDESASTKQNTRVPYTGPRLPRQSYIGLVLEELKGTNMQALTSRMAHQLLQLIHKCDFGQQPCNGTDFLTEFTDMGQCYTFNYNPNNFRKAFTTGAESGVRLILNVEQYEHVKDYVSGVGVKMHLHDQSDIASMRDLGVAAMPGVHNLATISYTNIESLLPPFGSCGSTDLPYFNSENVTTTYTEAKCRMEGRTNFVETHCHCKDIHMPGPTPVCTLAQDIDCKKLVTETSPNISSSAACPTACNVNSFTVGLSQSQLSGLDINTLLGNGTEELRQRYIRALEVRHRIDEEVMTTTIKDMELLIKRHKQLKDYVYFAVLDRGTSIPRHIEVALEAISRLVLEDIVRRGGLLLADFETAYLVNVKPRESYLEQSSTSLHAKLSLSKDLFKDLQKGVTLNSSWYAQTFCAAVSKLTEFLQVLSVHVHSTNTTGSYLPQIFTHPPCEACRNSIIASIPNLALLFENFTRPKNETVCGPCDRIIGEIDSMLMLLSNFSLCNSKYGSFLAEFRRWLDSLNFDFKEFSNSIDSEQVLKLFMHNDDWLMELKSNYSQNSISKLLLAERLLSDTSIKMTQDIDSVIQDIGQQIVAPLQNKVADTEEVIVVMYVSFLTYLVELANYTLSSEVEQYAKSLKFWRKPKPDLEVPKVLKFELSETDTWQVWPPEKSMEAFVVDSAKERLTLVSVVYFSQLGHRLLSFMSDMKAFQNLLLVSMETIKSSLLAYNDTTKIDDKFVMQNFLMLDIYYGEMKYEHISQSEAYTWTNFFSDLGSYFGLLMGCSLLTMIEVLDLVVYYLIVKLIERYQTPPRRREVIEVNNHVNLTPV